MTAKAELALAEAMNADLHIPIDRRELWYVRRVCKVCRTDWPCPDVAQRRSGEYGPNA